MLLELNPKKVIFMHDAGYKLEYIIRNIDFLKGYSRFIELEIGYWDFFEKGYTDKEAFEQLLAGESITTELDEQIVYHQLELDESAVWSLLLASGYLTVKKYWTEERGFGGWRQLYELRLTNLEVRIMFAGMVKVWFAAAGIKTDRRKAMLK